MQIVANVTTYVNTITKVFGEPTVGPNSTETDKTSIEWHFTIDGHDIELTDYKTYGVTPHGQHTFVVRSATQNAGELVKQKFKQAKVLSQAKFKLYKL